MKVLRQSRLQIQEKHSYQKGLQNSNHTKRHTEYTVMFKPMKNFFFPLSSKLKGFLKFQHVFEVIILLSPTFE